MPGGFAEQVKGQPGNDVVKGSNTVHGFLHFAVAPIAPLDRIGGCAQQAVIQEGQGLFDIGREEALQDLAQLGEALYTLAQPREFGQGCVGATAAVKETIDLIGDVAQRTELR